MKNEKEFVGTLRGFDDYVNVVLDDVTELEPRADGGPAKRTQLESVLLNGSNVALMVPGAGPDDVLGIGAAVAPAGAR